MPAPIVYIDHSTVRPGRIPELRTAIDRLVAFIKDREPQLLYYAFFVDDERNEMTVVAIHPDAASLERHMTVGAEEFRRFADLIDMRGIEVYGEPTGKVMDLLHAKARDLGTRGTVTVRKQTAGFERLGEG